MPRSSGGQKTVWEDRPLTTWQGARLLVLLFCFWKVILFGIIALAPGPGYDTSTTLLVDAGPPDTSIGDLDEVSTKLPGIVKFARWDAIYFAEIIRRGYVFEQEYAFASGYPSIVGFIQSGVSGDWADNQITTIAFLGVTLSTVCHLLSVLLLHRLSTTIFSKAPQSISSVPVAVAAVHIISPAGAFLSSPYSEALFSCLNILGFQLYLDGLRNHYRRRNPRADIQCLAAGAVFGFATSVRSNGLLSGSLFFYDATVTAISLVNGNFSIEKFRRLIVVGIGGCLTALGAIVPQYRAYASYCILEIGSETRPWCDDYVPSIYAWVQGHYWNVGLFRYWTISNMPLFLLAAPTLFVLCKSSIWAWSGDIDVFEDATTRRSTAVEPDFQRACLRRLAVPQALLAIMALLSYHVQVITRLSSAYPLWYMWLVSSIEISYRRGLKVPDFVKPGTIVRWMVIYALLQGVLFASFLPPA